MLIGDLIGNDEFDVNCNYAIYGGYWNDGGNLIWSTEKDGYSRPPCAIRDLEIGYITLDINRSCLVIEAKNCESENQDLWQG